MSSVATSGAAHPGSSSSKGLGFDRSGWGPVISALRRRFRLVLIDNRGSGRSTTAERKFTVADMAVDVTAVLDRSRISRAHVLGASLGGMVAQEVAIRFPQRVDRLVLACTTPGWPYGYPMPRASVRRMTEAASLPVEVAQRSLVENALAPGTLKTHPELVDYRPQPESQVRRCGFVESTGQRRLSLRSPSAGHPCGFGRRSEHQLCAAPRPRSPSESAVSRARTCTDSPSSVAGRAVHADL